MALAPLSPDWSTLSDRFRLLVDAVSDYGIFILDPQGHIVSWNSGARRIKGYAPEDVIGRHFSMFYRLEDRERGWPEQELRLASAEGRFEDEGWRVRKDGSQFWANVVITALRNADGSLAGYGKVTRDLTERRRHEESLRESEERFRLLVAGVQDYAIYMLSPAGLIESWNSGAQILTGYGAGEAIGRHFSMFYRDDDKQAGLPAAELATALRVGRAEANGWRVRRDASVFWANVVITPVHDAENRLRGFAKVTRDMTERRRLEALESASERMNRFLAMLAHELRNPLAPIRNAVTVLQLEPSPSPMVRNSRDMIDRQLSHLTRLVDDLLDAGRLTSGKITLKKERFSYNQVITRAAEASRPLMDARRHRLGVSVPAGDIHVHADPTRISQVVQNLLTNAAKFTPEGGRIELKVWTQGEQLFTSVADNGIGLAQDAMAHIFDLFSQADAPGTSAESGLGIGLTLAKSLVEMHGGTLTASSEGPGRGSTFRFFLPHVPEPADAASAAQEDMPRFLVVDDNRDAADSLGEVLRLMGCTVKIAYEGPAALQTAQEFRPHTVLVDLGMPGMDGFEVVRRLRASAGGERMTIAALTGYGTEDDHRRSLDAGFDMHLTKPVEFATMQNLLQQAAGGRPLRN